MDSQNEYRRVDKTSDKDSGLKSHKCDADDNCSNVAPALLTCAINCEECIEKNRGGPDSYRGPAKLWKNDEADNKSNHSPQRRNDK